MFDFHSYKLENQICKFNYRLDEFVFCEEIDFGELLINEDSPIIWNILFFLHLVLGISYYKLKCPKKIKISSGSLNKEQSDFFNKLYTNGLWEFFYINQIDFRNLIKFPYEQNSSFGFHKSNISSQSSLVPVWWGKDSSVVLSMLDNKDFDTLVLWKHDIAINICHAFGKAPTLIKRTLDPLLFKLTETWSYYNGHVPISSIIAWIWLMTAYLKHNKYIVLANESSANFWNTIWNGMEINHQYSKSLEFETDLNNFINSNITDITYFSLLRPFSELKIIEIFCKKASGLFKTFSSCNKNFKIHGALSWTVWCNKCPKCCFVFALLCPFIGISKCIDIFGENLFENINLLNTFIALTWHKWIKPFECVWTYDEAQTAIKRIIDWYQWKLPPVLKELSKYPLIDKFDELMALRSPNNVPNYFLPLVS